LPAEQLMSGRDVIYFGMHYVVPVVVDWPGTVIAINVGGALIPGLMSIYLLARNRLWGVGLVAVACVTAVCHQLADPVPGIGIALPVLVPALSAAFVALVLSRAYAAPLAYIGGSLGTLIGADLLNLDKLQGLGAPIASIGGAGTFDGVFLTGVGRAHCKPLPSPRGCRCPSGAARDQAAMNEQRLQRAGESRIVGQRVRLLWNAGLGPGSTFTATKQPT
jgi:uncharacterized membrane protein